MEDTTVYCSEAELTYLTNRTIGYIWGNCTVLTEFDYGNPYCLSYGGPFKTLLAMRLHFVEYVFHTRTLYWLNTFCNWLAYGSLILLLLATLYFLTYGRQSFAHILQNSLFSYLDHLHKDQVTPQ